MTFKNKFEDHQRESVLKDREATSQENRRGPHGARRGKRRGGHVAFNVNQGRSRKINTINISTDRRSTEVQGQGDGRRGGSERTHSKPNLCVFNRICETINYINGCMLKIRRKRLTARRAHSGRAKGTRRARRDRPSNTEESTHGNQIFLKRKWNRCFQCFVVL